MALIRPRTRALPYELRRNGERPRSAGGVQENGLCTKGYISGISPFNRRQIVPLQEKKSEHFQKGCVPDGNDIAKRGE